MQIILEKLVIRLDRKCYLKPYNTRKRKEEKKNEKKKSRH